MACDRRPVGRRFRGEARLIGAKASVPGTKSFGERRQTSTRGGYEGAALSISWRQRGWKKEASTGTSQASNNLPARRSTTPGIASDTRFERTEGVSNAVDRLNLLVQNFWDRRAWLVPGGRLLGGHGEPVFPVSAAGPDERYLGDRLWTSLADWLDACRKRGGLAVTAHFPYPIAEVGADIVLGKSDALEIYPDFGTGFDNPRFMHWYHALNCDYHLSHEEPNGAHQLKLHEQLQVPASQDARARPRALRSCGTFRTNGENKASQSTYSRWRQAIYSGCRRP